MNPTWTCMKFTWNLQDTYMTPTWNLHGTYMKSLHQKSSGKHIWTETRKRHTLNLHEPHLKPTWSKDMAHYWNNLQLSHFMFYVWSFHWICVILFMFDDVPSASLCVIYLFLQHVVFLWVKELVFLGSWYVSFHKVLISRNTQTNNPNPPVSWC